MEKPADWVREILQAERVHLQHQVQELWSGYGSIDRYAVRIASQDRAFIVKRVAPPSISRHPRGWNTAVSHQRKLRSYQVEAYWYQHWSSRCDRHCRVPIYLASRCDNEQQWLLMEDLDESGYYQRRQSLSAQELTSCLAWLANFHATFLHADPSGLWPEGSYWQLATRRDEWQVMEEGPLKSMAGDLDQRLRQARFRTLIHGDAKVANFCFNPQELSVAAVDFQYVGGGVGVRDLAYFLGSCLTDGECFTLVERCVDEYFAILKTATDAMVTESEWHELESEWRSLFPVAWTDFYRFLQGWMPQHRKINEYTLQIASGVLSDR